MYIRYNIYRWSVDETGARFILGISFFLWFSGCIKTEAVPTSRVHARSFVKTAARRKRRSAPSRIFTRLRERIVAFNLMRCIRQTAGRPHDCKLNAPVHLVEVKSMNSVKYILDIQTRIFIKDYKFLLLCATDNCLSNASVIKSIIEPCIIIPFSWK